MTVTKDKTSKINMNRINENKQKQTNKQTNKQKKTDKKENETHHTIINIKKWFRTNVGVFRRRGEAGGE